MDGVPSFLKMPGMGFSPIRSAAEPLFSEEVIGILLVERGRFNKIDVKISQKKWWKKTEF